MIVDDSKFEIFVDGKNIYAGADVKAEINDENITIETEIGKKTKQKLKIIITKMNYVEALEESTNKEKDTNE
jgi:hypothetical protein